jgi:hypothetical protein
MSCWTLFKERKYNIRLFDLMYGTICYCLHTAQTTLMWKVNIFFIEYSCYNMVSRRYCLSTRKKCSLNFQTVYLLSKVTGFQKHYFNCTFNLLCITILCIFLRDIINTLIYSIKYGPLISISTEIIFFTFFLILFNIIP